MTESPVRSIIKTFSWRITATLITILASLIITGKIDKALTIGAADFIAKLIVYFIHERIWNKVKFGKKEKKDPEYYI